MDLRPKIKKNPDPSGMAAKIAELQKEKELREQGYRARALKIFPHVCAHCGREFEGKRLRELTIHHKDSNHENNPPDGRNWELLCTYCHEYEHASLEAKGQTHGSASAPPQAQDSTFKPFQDLDKLLKAKDGKSNFKND